MKPLTPSQQLRAKRHYLKHDNQRFGNVLVEVGRAEWPEGARNAVKQPERVWRSRHYCVHFWKDENCLGRLCAHRAEIDSSGQWRDGLTWDELDELKRQAGFGDAWAVEVFPPSGEVVNVANMRHLWLLSEPPAFAWRKGWKQ